MCDGDSECGNVEGGLREPCLGADRSERREGGEIASRGVDPERLRRELAAAGLKNIRVETIAEATQFESGNALWDWIVSSNPIVECVLSPLNLTKDETEVVKQALEEMVSDHAGSNGAARLTNPINIGIGTK